MFNSKTPIQRARRISMAVAAGALLSTTALAGCSVANSEDASGGSAAPEQP